MPKQDQAYMSVDSDEIVRLIIKNKTVIGDRLRY